MPTQTHQNNYSLLITNYSLAKPFTFSAKEKDSETGLSVTSLREVSSLRLGNLRTSSHCTRSLRRFGSRYYSSDLSIWLSVDPMASKYPSFSTYVYWTQKPSPIDGANAGNRTGGRTFAAFGMSFQEVYFYNENGTYATWSFDQFRNNK